MWKVIESGCAILFGAAVTRLLTIGKNYIHNKRISKHLERMDKKMKEYNIISLGHVKPCFDEIREHDELFIPFPEDLASAVTEQNEKYFQDMKRKWSIFGKADEDALPELIIAGIKQIREKEESWGMLPDLQMLRDIIEQSRRVIAKEVVESLKKGQMRFNGPMLGVKEYQNKTNEASIRLFRTDYYTNRVMNKVYNCLRKQEYICAPKNVDEVNALYPFMAALGVDILIKLKNGTTMIVERSKKLENMEDESLWHVSMNEAVSHTDYQLDSSESYIDEELCVSRGLKEELKIPPEAIEKDSVQLTDVYFLQDKCEIGIAGMVALKKGVTETRVRLAHYGAKDSVLESEKEMKTVVLSALAVKRFLKKEKMTESCRYLFSVWLCRRGK